MPTTFYVSLTGQDSNSGTDEAHPLRHVQHGIDKLHEPGDTLKIRGGTYVESLVIEDKTGEDADGMAISIQSYDEEQAVIDSGYAPHDIGAVRFREPGNGLWHLLDGTIGEYVSELKFTWNHDNRLNRGAFLDTPRYTRLISYSNINDLRSTGQTFGRLPESLAPDGPFIVDHLGDPIKTIDGERINRPWVYMGPGVFHSPEDNRLHVRLSPTSNGISGLPDYEGETDPNDVPLTLSREATGTLTLRNCRHVTLSNVTVRYGADTVRVQSCQGVRLDHVRIFAGPKGVEMGSDEQGSTDTVFSNCEFDGGIPTWFFRTDEKGGYSFKDSDLEVQTNDLGSGTSGLLFAGAPTGTFNTEIHHCEFINGHDLQLVGHDFNFHHNWLHNMQDDALAIGFGANSGEVHQNVITSCQTAMSFASNVVGGPYRIYRNIFDLRGPISAIRPRPLGDVDGAVSPFRFGQFYKGSNEADDGPIDFFHNTCLVRFQEGYASFQMFAHSKSGGPRRSFNNIFVDIEPEPASHLRATAYLPTFAPGAWPSDGNCYFRVGVFFNSGDPSLAGVLRHEKYDYGDASFPPNEYASLAQFRADPGPPADSGTPPPGTYYLQSKSLYEPGYEHASIDVDPQFRMFDPAGDPTEADDLRLRASSLARHAGVILATPPVVPPVLDPFAPPSGPPDMGCYPTDDQPLRVGVDGRIGYPAIAALA